MRVLLGLRASVLTMMPISAIPSPLSLSRVERSMSRTRIVGCDIISALPSHTMPVSCRGGGVVCRECHGQRVETLLRLAGEVELGLHRTVGRMACLRAVYGHLITARSPVDAQQHLAVEPGGGVDVFGREADASVLFVTLPFGDRDDVFRAPVGCGHCLVDRGVGAYGRARLFAAV